MFKDCHYARDYCDWFPCFKDCSMGKVELSLHVVLMVGVAHQNKQFHEGSTYTLLKIVTFCETTRLIIIYPPMGRNIEENQPA